MGFSCLLGGRGGHCSAPTYSQATSKNQEVEQVTMAIEHKSMYCSSQSLVGEIKH